MPHSIPETRLREELQHGRRTHRPLFFNPNENDWDLSAHLEIPLTTALPHIEELQGMTHGTLRHLFKSRIRDNEQGLTHAYINRHDAPHMDRVANGTYHMGMYLGYPQVDVRAATLATRFHDVGYEFPENATPSELEVLGKELHANHAPMGADYVTDALREMWTRSCIREELKGWSDRTFDVVHDSIRLHSNSIGTDESAASIALVPRLMDKLDNTQARVRPEHIDNFRLALNRSIQHIKQRVRSRSRHTLSRESFNSSKSRRTKMDVDQAREHLAAVDPYYFHRLAPYAIADQRLFLNPEEISAIVEYRVYPSVVGNALNIPYANDDHRQDFCSAYDKSMLNAAQVLHILRSRQPYAESSDATLLTVRMVYEDGRQHVLNYEPSLFTASENTSN